MINHYLFIFFQQGLLSTVTKQRGGNWHAANLPLPAKACDSFVVMAKF